MHTRNHDDSLEMSSNRGQNNLTAEDKALLLLQTPKTIQPRLPTVAERKDLFLRDLGQRVFIKIRFKSNHQTHISVSETNEKVQWLTTHGYIDTTSGDPPVKLAIAATFQVEELQRRITNAYRRNESLALNAILTERNSVFELDDARLHPNDTNQPANLYAAHNGIPQRSIGEIVKSALNDAKLVTLATSMLYKQLGIVSNQQIGDIRELLGIRAKNFHELIHHVHQPQNIEHALAAKEDLELLATYVFVKRFKEEQAQAFPIESLSINLEWMKQAALSFAFAPTREQQKIALSVLSHFQGETTTSHLIYGDVGYGKTAVMLMIIHQLIMNGKNVVVLAPAEHLAIQTYEVFCRTLPNLANNFKLVTANTGERVQEEIEGLCYVGTSALLFRDDEAFKPYCIFVDEEQRFGVEQRDYFRNQGSHYVAASATPIPRTIAGTLLGYYYTHTLTKCFVDKSFVGKLYMEEAGRRALYNDLKASLSQGRQTLIICPLTRESESEMFTQMVNVEDLYSNLRERFGDIWRLVHSKLDTEHNNSSLNDMREGRALGLVASTAVEVGIDIPDLKDIYIFHPERFGLTQLHQLRGRIVRQGGVGFIRLFSPTLLTQEQVNRLEYFLNEPNGAKVAEYDAQRRGVGDLFQKGQKQSGVAKQATFIRHLVISYDVLKRLFNRIGQRAW